MVCYNWNNALSLQMTAMALIASAVQSVKNTIPFLKPLRAIIVAFGITGWLIYKIPISGLIILVFIFC